MRVSRGWASLALQLVTVATSLVAPGVAHAFGGFYAGTGDGTLVADASHVVLVREGQRTVLSLQNDYRGPPATFALVVPVPVVLQKEHVRTLPPEVFEHIDRLDAPRLVEYWEQDPCSPLDVPRPASASVRPRPPPSSRAAGAGSADPGVTIEAQFTVAEYEIVILSAKDSAGLEAWLRREGYRIPEGAGPLLRPYLERGDKFFVARVDVTKVKRTGDRVTLSPLRFHYDAPELTLPLRLGLASSPGTQELVVHVLGKGKRYDVASYPKLTIPTNLDVAEEAKGDFGAFYAALFDRTVAKTKGAFVTEYAWDAGACDPCAVPPLTDAELVTLGADVLPSVTSEAQPMDDGLLRALGASSAGSTPAGSAPRPARRYYGLGSSFVLTRLHARYAPGAITDDLVLHEAPALVGGREVRHEGQLETGAHEDPSGRNAFQGRYAVRHPWTGPMACERPVRNRWGGPPSGLDNGAPRSATSLAYARRDGVQLASFLRTDVTSLGVRATGAIPSGVGTFSAPSPSPPTGDGATGEAGLLDAGGTASEGKRGGCLGCSTAPSGRAAPAVVAAALALATAFARRRRHRPPSA